jgi:hypothetical protein
MVFIKCELKKIEWEVVEYERIDKWCTFSLCFTVTTLRSRSSLFVLNQQVKGKWDWSNILLLLWTVRVVKELKTRDVRRDNVSCKKKEPLCCLWNCYILIGCIPFSRWSKCLTSVWRSPLLLQKGISLLCRARYLCGKALQGYWSGSVSILWQKLTSF